MRQRRWLELLKDYDLTINYHPRKANVVADALSRKSMENLTVLITHQSQLLEDIRKLKLDIRIYDSTVRLANMRVQPTLIERIIVAQNDDPQLMKIKNSVEAGVQSEFKIHDDGSLRFENRICIPNDSVLKHEILQEAHQTGYTVHPGGTKMYRDLKKMY